MAHVPLDLLFSSGICSPQPGERPGNEGGNRHNRGPQPVTGGREAKGWGYSSLSATEPTGKPAEVNSISHATPGPILTRCRGRTLPLAFSVLVDT